MFWLSLCVVLALLSFNAHAAPVAQNIGSFDASLKPAFRPDAWASTSPHSNADETINPTNSISKSIVLSYLKDIYYIKSHLHQHVLPYFQNVGDEKLARFLRRLSKSEEEHINSLDKLQLLHLASSLVVVDDVNQIRIPVDLKPSLVDDFKPRKPLDSTNSRRLDVVEPTFSRLPSPPSRSHYILPESFDGSNENQPPLFNQPQVTLFPLTFHAIIPLQPIGLVMVPPHALGYFPVTSHLHQHVSQPMQQSTSVTQSSSEIRIHKNTYERSAAKEISRMEN